MDRTLSSRDGVSESTEVMEETHGGGVPRPASRMYDQREAA